MSERIVDMKDVPIKTIKEINSEEALAFLWGLPVHEEVVRCRDCKWFSLDNSDHDYRSGWWCHRWNTDMVKPDGFCAWGEPTTR